MKVRSHRLREMTGAVQVPLSTLGYRDFIAQPDVKHNLISFTSLVYDSARKRVLCGLTSFDNDLMYEFDPAGAAFRSLNYPPVAEKFEIKIHRSLHLLGDGRVMGATACLHREDQRREGPGGRIFVLDPVTGEYDFLGIPVPHDYIQTITVDEERGLVYGFTYPVFNFFVFDMRRRVTRRMDYMGSIPHIVALDDRGGYWATWNCRDHNLFRYDPDRDDIDWYQHSVPHRAQSTNLMYPGAGPIDSMVNGRDGSLYIGEAFGNLVRLDPRTGAVEDLGKPAEETRMAALEIGPDGHLYGIAGFLKRCHLFRYDRQKRRFEVLGHIVDPEDGVPLFIGHDMCFAGDHTILIGETDTADRAGRLWEVTL